MQNEKEKINPFDILSGKVVQTTNATYWFKEPGHNMREDGLPVYKNLHRENDLPAIIYAADNRKAWYVDGKPLKWTNRKTGEIVFNVF